MEGAQGHTETGTDTSPNRVVYGLPNVVEVVESEDFEGLVGHGVGLARRQPYEVFTLSNPSRVVLDIRTDYTKVWRGVHFFDERKFDQPGDQANTTVRPRSVPAGTPAGAVLHHLFAGPTAAERRAGLRTVRSGASGFKGLRIRDYVAHVTLTGGCTSASSPTFTVADQIAPTLKQFSNVLWVKIYDPSGRTEQPDGRIDSIPECLEP
jgi:hypothetical protein